LLGSKRIAFDSAKDLIFHRRKSLPYHPNGMTFTALDADGAEVASKTYYSVGGGFVVNAEGAGADRIKEDDTVLPYPFKSGADLLRLCAEHRMPISRLMFENERCWRSDSEIRDGLLRIWDVMQRCVERGCAVQGTLPGGMKVKRRAHDLFEKL